MTPLVQKIIDCCHSGMTDRKISETCCCTLDYVKMVRRKNGMNVNPDKQGRSRKVDRNEFLRLYSMDYNDQECAEYFECAPASIWRIRTDMGLKAIIKRRKMK